MLDGANVDRQGACAHVRHGEAIHNLCNHAAELAFMQQKCHWHLQRGGAGTTGVQPSPNTYFNMCTSLALGGYSVAVQPAKGSCRCHSKLGTHLEMHSDFAASCTAALTDDSFQGTQCTQRFLPGTPLLQSSLLPSCDSHMTDEPFTRLCCFVTGDTIAT